MGNLNGSSGSDEDQRIGGQHYLEEERTGEPEIGGHILGLVDWF